ncbi:MAG: DNA-directed RNA polymerase subunit D [Candidatus Micrarchaeota archaeon]|nr:DNA-directed RNA polymerase subunit D [Candidatus Micrarchaeota archaeon]
MQVNIEKEQANRIQFTISGTTVAFSNAVRRYSMTHNAVLAMDTVVFYDNTASLFDEYIAHRIGLIPVVTPDKTPESAEIIFSLDETGPKMVYAKDLKSSDKGIAVARENIPIITLTEGQHLKFEAKAIIGYGTKHAKFQAGLVSYAIKDNTFKFIVESFYQMEPSEVILRACVALEKDATDILKGLKAAAKKK